MKLRSIGISEPKCPDLVYLIWQSGRHAAIWKECGHWRCEKCAKTMMRTIVNEYADVSRGLDFVHRIRVPQKRASAIRKSVQRAQQPSLRITFHGGGLLMLTNEPLAGRGWTTERVDRFDSADDLLGLEDITNVHRHDFTNYWKTNRPKVEKTDTAIWRRPAGSLTELRLTLKRLGQDLDNETIAGSAVDFVETLRSWEGDY